MKLSEEEILSFKENGYLILRGILSDQETLDLQKWVNEVHDWPTDASSEWMPYEEVNADGKLVLSRTENFAASHAALNALLRGKKLLDVLHELSGEKMVLFKEKINYKLARSGGFAAHIDAGAYTQIRNIEHLTALVAVDAADTNNGCMEAVKGSHKMNIPIADDNCIELDWSRNQDWTPIELNAGEILIFGSYLAHRSAANHSDQDRKALYATYNGSSEGDLHDMYYRQRRIEWPPMNLRKAGENLEKGAWIHANGTPMMSVELGHQLAV